MPQPLEEFRRKRIQGAADICTSNRIQQLFTSFLFKPAAVSTQLGPLGEPDNTRNCKIIIYLPYGPSRCRYDKVNKHLTFIVRAYLSMAISSSVVVVAVAGRSLCMRCISSGKISIGIVPAIPNSCGLTTLRPYKA
uniref:Uncharacterized protein n=1 Tax=Glossina austeni TaxID=7395 RepID=A0A1A9V3Z7_GLOAU